MPYLLATILLTISYFELPDFAQDKKPILIDENYQINVPCEMTRTESKDRLKYEGVDEGIMIVLNRRGLDSYVSDSLTVFALSDGEIAGMNIREPHSINSDNYEPINNIPVRTLYISSAKDFLVFSYFANGNFIYAVRFYSDKRIDSLYVEKILNTLKMR